MRAMLKAFVPDAMKPALRRIERDLSGWKDQWHLDRVHARSFEAKPGMLLPCGPYMVRINDGPNFFMQYKDIFINRVYHFDTESPAPTILDCGGNIGMSVLYYKLIYPEAQITTFEPDPAVFGYLLDNMTRHGMDDVRLVQAAVCGRLGRYASTSTTGVANLASETAPLEEGWTNERVPCVRLSSYLAGPIDFLKINIEGGGMGSVGRQRRALAARQRDGDRISPSAGPAADAAPHLGVVGSPGIRVPDQRF